MLQNGKNAINSEDSSSSSPSQATATSSELSDLTLFGAMSPLCRTGTVRRVSAPKKIQQTANNEDEPEFVNSPTRSGSCGDRYRRSLDSTYRLSLDSISEYKTRSSFSSTSMYASRGDASSSIDSSSSDCAEHAPVVERATSPGANYLNWIESVNSEYFDGSTTTLADCNPLELDGKVGEWNNFWLNYNSAKNRYVSSPYVSTSNDDRTGDEYSDAKSTSSAQLDKNYSLMCDQQVNLSLDELQELIKCSKRITEILQSALKRNETECDSKNESFYSQQNSSSVTKEEILTHRERSFSYAPDLQKQQLLKPTPQSASSSCINALLNNGVTDILKRVINKKRDVFGSDENQFLSKSGFSSWSNSKLLQEQAYYLMCYAFALNFSFLSQEVQKETVELLRQTVLRISC